MSSSTEKAEKLTLKGRLTIGNAQKIYNQILAAFKNIKHLKIYLSEISEIDLAFLQILYYLLATTNRSGKGMSVFIDEPEGIWDLIVKAGFETHFSINNDPG